MQDHLFINGLRLSTIIGCLPAEQQRPQPIIIDVLLQTDCQAAALTDNIQHTINYAEVAECITTHVDQHHYQLVETLAEKLAELLLKKFSVSQVTLKISKPNAISYADSAGVQIVRNQSIK